MNSARGSERPSLLIIAFVRSYPIIAESIRSHLRYWIIRNPNFFDFITSTTLIPLCIMYVSSITVKQSRMTFNYITITLKRFKLIRRWLRKYIIKKKFTLASRAIFKIKQIWYNVFFIDYYSLETKSNDSLLLCLFAIIKNSEPTSNYTKNFAHVSRQSW